MMQLLFYAASRRLTYSGSLCDLYSYFLYHCSKMRLVKTYTDCHEPMHWIQETLDLQLPVPALLSTTQNIFMIWPNLNTQGWSEKLFDSKLEAATSLRVHHKREVESESASLRFKATTSLRVHHESKCLKQPRV